MNQIERAKDYDEIDEYQEEEKKEQIFNPRPLFGG